ncbi:MAG: hypothetical protein DSY85_13740 [Marinomonas sp.]|nr:MAG: hypothetical protein DSY85_13740 [Marinomonas sp.]|tara:strand:+ start:484 stop:756 length:273 start_codon:yes stop_codon:yes gene_type:complete
MELQTEDAVWRLAGRYDATELLKIKKSLVGVKCSSDQSLDLSGLESMNAPIIALLIEIRRSGKALTLLGCRAEFKEMFKLYGVQKIFQFD